VAAAFAAVWHLPWQKLAAGRAPPEPHVDKQPQANESYTRRQKDAVNGQMPRKVGHRDNYNPEYKQRRKQSTGVFVRY